MQDVHTSSAALAEVATELCSNARSEEWVGRDIPILSFHWSFEDITILHNHDANRQHAMNLIMNLIPGVAVCVPHALEREFGACLCFSAQCVEPIAGRNHQDGLGLRVVRPEGRATTKATCACKAGAEAPGQRRRVEVSREEAKDRSAPAGDQADGDGP